MKSISIIPIAAFVVLMMTGCKCDTSKVELNDYRDSLSWVLGNAMGTQFQALEQYNNLELNKDIVKQAFANTIDNLDAPISDSAAQLIYLQFTAMIEQNNRAIQQQAQTSVEDREKEYFEKLVAEHPKVVKDKSGIYYEVIKAGKGRKAKVGDRIKFDYKGYNMLTGELFDQTYGQREPIMHVLGEPMFAGLVEGMKLMNAGSIYRLYIPNQMAFGAAGTRDIPPYTPVIYEVELHEVYDD